MKKLILLLFAASTLYACKNNTNERTEVQEEKQAMQTKSEFPYPISLAQWSLHKRYEAEGSRPLEFPKDAKELGFNGVELVTQLYTNEIESLGFKAVIDSLKAEGDRHGLEFVLIMIDEEGDLADPDEKLRDEAVEKHKKWVDAAAQLGARSVRVNTFGTNTAEEWLYTVKDGLTKLSTYAASKNINVLVENHGWLSSNPKLVMSVLDEMNMDNCGTLPDFGNWCIERVNQERWGECTKEYPDMYEGIAMMLPRAKGVSAKSRDFDAQGNEVEIDYVKMLRLIKNSDFDGWIGIEYEGDSIGEVEGIKLTRELLKNAYQQL